MRITKWGEYGILCSLYLAQKYSDDPDQDQAVGAAEIAERQLIPLQYTQQILQRLRKGDIIVSLRGPHGGYKLSRPPEQINLHQVLLAAEGRTFEVVCDNDPVYDEVCRQAHQCALRDVWGDLKESIDKLLAERTLAALLEKHDFIPADEKRKFENSVVDSSLKVVS